MVQCVHVLQLLMINIWFEMGLNEKCFLMTLKNGLRYSSQVHSPFSIVRANTSEISRFELIVRKFSDGRTNKTSMSRHDLEISWTVIHFNDFGLVFGVREVLQNNLSRALQTIPSHSS